MEDNKQNTQQGRTLEEKAADTILQKTKEVKIGKRTYKVAPPSTATLIMVSEAVSKLPLHKFDNNPEKMLEQVLAYGRDCRAVGEIAAILVLGARGCYPYRIGRRCVTKSCLWGLIKYKKYLEPLQPIVDPKAELTQDILELMSPAQITELIMSILGDMQVADFFGLTTFLSEINLLRKTKVD